MKWRKSDYKETKFSFLSHAHYVSLQRTQTVFSIRLKFYLQRRDVITWIYLVTLLWSYRRKQCRTSWAREGWIQVMQKVGFPGEVSPKGLIGTFQTKSNSLESMLEDILSNKFDRKHGFFACWLYPGFWKKETIFAFITEFKGKCVLDAQVISPV